MVVALQCGNAHGIGTQDGNGAEFSGERQETVVLEQYQGFPGCFQVQSLMLGSVQKIMIHFQTRRFLIQAQPKSLDHNIYAGIVYIRLGDQAPLQRFRQVHIDEPQIHVAAVFEGEGRGFRRVLCYLMPRVKILQRREIRDDHTLKIPVFPQHFLQQQFRSTAGFSQRAVICAHDLRHARFLYRRFKSRQVSLVQVLLTDFRIELMADGFRAGMNGIVLRAGGGEQIIRIISLQSRNIAHAHAAGEPGVFPIGLLTAAPSRVPENVDIGAVKAESFEQVPDAVGGILLIFDAGFLTDGPADLLYQLGIEGGPHADALGIHGRRSLTGRTVERFAPPVHFRDAQPLQCRRGGKDLRDLFFCRHAGDQVFRTLGKTQAGIQISLHFSSPYRNDVQIQITGPPCGRPVGTFFRNRCSAARPFSGPPGPWGRCCGSGRQRCLFPYPDNRSPGSSGSWNHP